MMKTRPPKQSHNAIQQGSRPCLLAQRQNAQYRIISEQLNALKFRNLRRMYAIISAFATQEFTSFWWLITGSLSQLKCSFTYLSQFVNGMMLTLTLNPNPNISKR